MSPGSRTMEPGGASVRIVFNCAMRWELLQYQSNPMSFVRNGCERRTASWFGYCCRRAQAAGLNVPLSSLVQVQVVQIEIDMAEACGSRNRKAY
jgi:hypothetical protein